MERLGRSMVNFFNSFLSYLILLVIIVVIAGIGIILGIFLRKRKNTIAAQEDSSEDKDK